MINKIDTTGVYDCPHLILANKINEIIDHLPQEKEYCKCKTPLPDTTNHCHTCGFYIKQPTKEVPDIQKIKEILLKPLQERDPEKCFLVGWVDEGQLQAISALYTRGNK